MKAIQQLEAEIEQIRATAPALLGNSGPKTVPGKQRVALNGVTHGLTGQNVFLEAGEYPAYMNLGAQYIAELRPVGVRETQLAQKIIDTNWRLNTIAAVENNLFNSTLVACLKASDRDGDPSDDKTATMVAKANAWKTDCEGPNAFDKLGRYEARLQRAQYKLTEEIERFQSLRLKKGPDTFDLATCTAHAWYDKMYTLHTELAAARLVEAEARTQAEALAEIQLPAEAAPVNDSESTASTVELLCKKPEAALELLRFAASQSLLSPENQALVDRLTAQKKEESRSSETPLSPNVKKAAN